MDLATLSAIGWDHPAFAPYRAFRSLAARDDWRDGLNERAVTIGVRTTAGSTVEFVDPAAAVSVAYEAHIAATGRVPTRGNAHDFFNALAWLCFPLTKGRLNELQAQAIARQGVAERRGALRDAATVFDENGLLLVTRRSDRIDALRRRDWHALFLDERAVWTDAMRAIVFGHALLEKLARPYKALTAHAIDISLDPDASLESIDENMAQRLDEGFSTRGLLPLPVLGIPGWWQPNENPVFYDDTSVFRRAD